MGWTTSVRWCLCFRKCLLRVSCDTYSIPHISMHPQKCSTCISYILYILPALVWVLVVVGNKRRDDECRGTDGNVTACAMRIEWCSSCSHCTSVFVCCWGLVFKDVRLVSRLMMTRCAVFCCCWCGSCCLPPQWGVRKHTFFSLGIWNGPPLATQLVTKGICFVFWVECW